jgi:hypothetical protein
LLVLLGIAVLASIVSWPRESEKSAAPILSGAKIPAQLLATVERSCGDCHSEKTRYPWYSYVAPVSWLIQSDVARGREHLNLSIWNEYSPVRRQRCLSEIANQVRDKEMPLATYTFIHRDAKLSDKESEAIFQWTQAERVRLITESSTPAH